MQPRGNSAAVRAARQRALQHHATVAGNLQRQRQAQASLTHRIAAAIAAQEGIELEPAMDETTFVASIRGLTPEQSLRLQWRVIVLMVALSAAYWHEPALVWADILIALAGVLEALRRG